ncbi:MAG: hypothetical protein J6J36_08155 [Clostridia bacterium]|nr:hypothetical protein [Clostridia bacterium]MBP3708546.1 hypothetical protein [Clostridia bacterium]
MNNREEIYEALKSKLFYMYDELYRSGSLGATPVYSYNKCVTAREILGSLGFPGSIRRNIKRLEKMIDINDERDIELVKEVYELYLKYYEDMDFIKYERLYKVPYDIQNKINMVNREFERYHSFCSNQNPFDNMISLIKIYERMKMAKSDLILNAEFDSTGGEYSNYMYENVERDMKDQVLSELRPMRFKF